MKALRGLVLAAAACACGNGWAQAAPAPKTMLQAEGTGQKKSAFDMITEYAKVDLSVPGSPAFNVLGINPDKVQRPGSIREFATSITRGLGPDGKFTNGLALDFSPVSVFAKTLIQGGDGYAPAVADGEFPSDLAGHGYVKRVFARTTVSFATTEQDANGAARSAWGLRMGLIDYGDPGLYWQFTAKCLRSTPMPTLRGGRNLDPTPADTSLDACNPLTNPIAMRRPLWAQPALYVGYGQSWYSKSGAVTDHAPDAKAAWLSFSIGHAALMKTDASSDWRVLLQLYANRRLDDRVPDPNDATALLRQDSGEGTLRLRFGKDTWHGYVEHGRRRVRLGDDTREKLRVTAFGAEFKLKFLSDETWLQLASVREQGFADGKDKTGLTVSFKFGVPLLELPGTAEKK